MPAKKSRPSSKASGGWYVREDEPVAVIPGSDSKGDFRSLVPLYGTHFCFRLARSFGRGCLGDAKESVDTYASALRRLFASIAALAIAAPDAACGRLFNHLTNTEGSPPEQMLSDAVQAVVEKIRDRNNHSIIVSKSDRTRMGLVGAINGGLRRLTEDDFLPLIRPAKYRRLSVVDLPKIPTLAELAPGGRAPVAIHDGMSLDDHLSAVQTLNLERLAALRECLEKELLAEYEAFRRGQTFISTARVADIRAIQNCLKAVPLQSSRARLRGMVELQLKRAFGSACDFLALAVRWIAARRKGILRMGDMSKKEHAMISLAGGRRCVLPCLEASPVAANACFGILLIDTALNVAVLEELPQDPFIGKASRGQIKVGLLSGIKIRAGGKPVSAAISEFEEEYQASLPLKDSYNAVSGIEAIRMYQEMSAPIRKRCSPKVAKCFWLQPFGTSLNGGPVVAGLKTAASTLWPNFLDRHKHHPVIGGLRITRQMIRTTVKSIRAVKNGFHHAIVQTLGDHSSPATTMGYILKPWIRAQLSEQVRSFQTLLEATLAENIPGAAESLGIDQDELRRRVEVGIEAGLDFVCVTLRPADQKNIAHGPTCDPLQPCDTCPVRRFVPTDENFITLHLAHRALRQAEGSLLAVNPERWAKIWLPWRAMTEAYVGKLRESPHRRRYEMAASLADSMLASNQVALPIVK